VSDDRIDLEQLRQVACAGDEPLDQIRVSRRWLVQVHEEITAGRVAQAQLHRTRCMDDVIQDLRTGPTERTSTL